MKKDKTKIKQIKNSQTECLEKQLNGRVIKKKRIIME